MSHPANDAIREDRLSNRKDWMAEKKTELDLWLEEKGLSLTDVFIENGKFYVVHDGKRIDLPEDLEEKEEDYNNEI